MVIWKNSNPRLIVTEGRLCPPGQGCEAHRSVKKHHFVRRVEEFYPDSSSGSNAADEIPIEAKGVFTLAELGIAGILEKGFLNKYARGGGLYMMAADQQVERHNTACVAAGVLHLSVDDETYSALGLNGEKSPFACQPGFRRITVDLTREAFCAASPEFDRVRACLLKMNPSRFVSAHDPHNGAAQEAVDFDQKACTYQKRCACKCEPAKRVSNLRLPVPPAQGWSGKRDEGADLWEWLSLLHQGATSPLTWTKDGRPVDEYPSSFASPQILDFEKGGGRLVRTDGFIMPSHAASILERARAAVESGKSPWASVCMWGSEAAPLSWGGARRSDSRDGGGHHVLILIQPGGKSCILFEAVGGFDEHSNMPAQH